MKKRFTLLGMDFAVGETHDIDFSWGGKFEDREVAANLAAIREARANADVVVFSIHAHEHAQGPVLRRMAHQFIDAGADVFFAQGPHHILGIEIYKGKPIFYGMGDFVFQIDQVERFPSEMYEEFGLGEDAPLEEVKKAVKNRIQEYWAPKRETWESFAAVLNFQEGRITDIRLIPQDLGFGQPSPTLGRPKYADNKLGKYIIDYAIKESAKYGTQIEYVESQNIGKVIIPN